MRPFPGTAASPLQTDPVSEFHDLAELALNRAGQSWGNLGYWKNANDYSDACRALATLLGEQAALDHHSIVFDAGFGCGDQLLLWLEHFGVLQISGVNLSRSQTAHARTLLAGKGQADASAAIRRGDVNDPAIWKIALDGTKPSHVLALDCAYHFPDRLAFWGLAGRHLAPAGRLVLTDFMLDPRHRTKGFRHRLLCWMLKRARIAEANIVNEQIYRDQLVQAGYGGIGILDISEYVMPAFSAGSDRKLTWPVRCKYAVTSRFLKWAYRRSILRYCLVSATKVSGSDRH